MAASLDKGVTGRVKITETEPHERSFTITMTESQLRMLAGVIDFPCWSDQPEDVAAFCREIAAQTYDALGEHVGAETIGMVNGRNSIAY